MLELTSLEVFKVVFKKWNLVVALALVLTGAQASRTALASTSADVSAESSDSRSSSDDLTLSQDEVLKAVEDFGGDAATDLAKVVETIFAKSGKPNAIIVGSEAQGALFVGYRKGSGKLIFPGQTVANAQEIFWNAPSIGFNIGGSASKVAVLVYGAASIDALTRRFASIEGSYHTIAGVGISYLRSSLDLEDKNAINLAYITVGVGLDGGVAVEALSFSKNDRWL